VEQFSSGVNVVKAGCTATNCPAWATSPAAWIASGIAMLGLTATLLRMPNDEVRPPATRTVADPGQMTG
jgi:hypothetical protein